MLKYIVAGLFLAVPALAQQPMTPEQTWNALFHQEAEARAQAVLQITILQRQAAQRETALAAAVDRAKKAEKELAEARSAGATHP